MFDISIHPNDNSQDQLSMGTVKLIPSGNKYRGVTILMNLAILVQQYSSWIDSYHTVSNYTQVFIVFLNITIHTFRLVEYDNN